MKTNSPTQALMGRRARWHVAVIATCLGFALGGCNVDADDLMIVDQIQPDGKLRRTYLLSNLRYTGSDKTRTPRANTLKEVGSTCDDIKRQARKENWYTVQRCGVSKLPALFGALLGGVRGAKPGQIDALAVLTSKHLSGTKKFLSKSGTVSLTVSGGIRISAVADSMGTKKLSCTHFIPW